MTSDRAKDDAWVQESQITRRGRIEDVLVNIEVAERVAGRLVFRNAGVLFFAKNVRHFFPQAYVTCLLARGTDKVDILDRKDFAGGVVSDIEESLRFIARKDAHLPTASNSYGVRMSPNTQRAPCAKRLPTPLCTATTLRWARTFFVEIYADHIEISNPGGLPKGLTRAELGTRSVRS